MLLFCELRKNIYCPLKTKILGTADFFDVK